MCERYACELCSWDMIYEIETQFFILARLYLTPFPLKVYKWMLPIGWNLIQTTSIQLFRAHLYLSLILSATLFSDPLGCLSHSSFLISHFHSLRLALIRYISLFTHTHIAYNANICIEKGIFNSMLPMMMMMMIKWAIHQTFAMYFALWFSIEFGSKRGGGRKVRIRLKSFL
jgi:hypothetical protein